MKKSVIVSLLGLAVLAPPLLSQGLKGHDANAPVDVDADRIEVQDRDDRAIFVGNVRVRQEGLSLNAARLTVAYNKVNGGSPQIERLDAQGGVSVVSATETAHSDVAIYDLNHKLITMIGSVDLQQGGNSVKGARLLIDLNSGRSVIDGSAVGASTSDEGVSQPTSTGRVTGHFTVPQRKP